MKLYNLCLLSLCCLAGSLSAKEVTISESDNGKTIALEVGDVLHVVLDGNPTTGYTWEPVAINEGQLNPDPVVYQSFSNLCGSGGQYTFTYTVAAGTSSRLTMLYARHWEKGVSPEKKFEVTIFSENAHQQ